MFCPQCGQQQISSETRFCSRCGLPLNLIGEVVIHGGTLPQLEQLNQQSNTLSRSLGLKFGLVWFLVLTFLLTPVFAVMDWDDLVALTAIVGFIGGILIMVFSLMFLKNNPKEISQPNNIRMPEANPQFLRGNADATTLCRRSRHFRRRIMFSRKPVRGWQRQIYSRRA